MMVSHCFSTIISLYPTSPFSSPLADVRTLHADWKAHRGDLGGGEARGPRSSLLEASRHEELASKSRMESAPVGAGASFFFSFLLFSFLFSLGRDSMLCSSHLVFEERYHRN